MDRRSMLSLMGIAGLAACAPSRAKGRSVQTITYGDDPSQFAELTRAKGASKGIVVIIHGGFWRSLYDLSLGRPLAESLASNGWDAYNLEYRRVGNGGGWPATFEDVSAGIDALADVGLDTSKVITMGHSAGGHLAVLAAGRAGAAVPVTAAVSQAGVLDLEAARDDILGSGAVRAFMGDSTAYDAADPTAQIPLAVPVRCIHAIDDDTVPISQSIGYVERASAAGADAELTRVEGDHFVVIDPSSPPWARTLEILEAL